MTDIDKTTAANTTKPAVATHFLRNLIEADLAANKFAQKKWGGQPGDANFHEAGSVDHAKIRTRFPPEPNGYLHIGHAKSICLNFGIAQDYEGICHLRMDDTNPEKEDDEYVNGILDAVKWLGFDWNVGGTNHYYHASDYFDAMYQGAELLIQHGHAYVDEQTPEQMRLNRGTLTEKGTNSPWRDRSSEESLRLFREMKAGQHPDGSLALRAKIDMASPNINMRDPVIYRIRHTHHHRQGDKWCIYPMYTYAHPFEDAYERITHSFCTLEFEDQRPFYEWVLDRLTEAGMFKEPLPRQTEFSRLNLSYVITSKRKLMQLVNEQHVDGWDDPRMPTIVGLRRRGYTPGSLRLFCERIGISKSDSWIDYSILEQALRDDLDPVADRSVAVLKPLKLIITNFPEDATEECVAPKHPHDPERGQRTFTFGKELWIEREDFEEHPPKGFFRLFPGNTVRLKYAFIIQCTGFKKNEAGEVIEVYAEYLPDTKSGTPGSSSVKVKGNITWVCAKTAVAAEFHLYDRLFLDAHPDSGDKDFLSLINPQSRSIEHGYLEAGTSAEPGKHWQFERLGYFVADRERSTASKPIINRTATLKDNWAKK